MKRVLLILLLILTGLAFTRLGVNEVNSPEGSVPASIGPAVEVPPVEMSVTNAPTPNEETDLVLVRPAEPPLSPISVVEMQTARVETTVDFVSAEGLKGKARLSDLQPNVGAWLLLELTWASGATQTYHLVTAESHRGQVRLEPDFEHGLSLGSGADQRRCELWLNDNEVDKARSRSAYSPLCDGAVFLLSQVEGHRTSKEWVTDFLRDRVPGGESVTSFVKEELMKDAFLQTAEFELRPQQAATRKRPPGSPLPGELAEAFEASAFLPVDLGLQLDHPAGSPILMGRWYPSAIEPGVFIASLEPRAVTPAVSTPPIDEVEARALTYLVAFDLDRFSLGFTVGTDHPRVEWSERALSDVRVAGLPGPDGFGTVAPLVRAGRLRPDLVSTLAATFVGGFKRTHGAFRTGDLARQHRGSHYGFIEQGVVLSALQPGLSTLIVELDGSVRLETWSATNDLSKLRFARQNGVPIVEVDQQTGEPRPGRLVTRWADGNWSGSQDKKFRTLRSGLCLQRSTEGRFLIYGFFSSVTPSAMARVFLGYDCEHAMLLDMNALEHSYLALYERGPGGWKAQHVVRGMEVLDQTLQGLVLPRFVAYPDNRDFFYLNRKHSSPETTEQ